MLFKKDKEVLITRADIFDDNFNYFLFMGAEILDIVRVVEVFKRNICHFFFPDKYTTLSRAEDSFLVIPLWRETNCEIKDINIDPDSFICKDKRKSKWLDQLVAEKDILSFVDKIFRFKTESIEGRNFGCIPLFNFDFKLKKKSEECKITENDFSILTDRLLDLASRFIFNKSNMIKKELEVELEIKYINTDKNEAWIEATYILRTETTVDFPNLFLFGQQYEDIIEFLDENEKAEISMERFKIELKRARERNNDIMGV